VAISSVDRARNEPVVPHPTPVEPPEDLATASKNAVTASATKKSSAEPPKEKPPASPKAPEATADVKSLASRTPVPTPSTPETKKEAPPSVAPVVELPTWGPLNKWAGGFNDCQATQNGDAFTLTIPASPHVFVPGTENHTAPRLLAEVEGDFLAQVTISGPIRPGTQPLANLPFFTFQGAGLLLWQSETNYVRLERTASYLVGAGAKTQTQVLLENCKEGNAGQPLMISVKDGTIVLRLERRGGEINCTYTSDGKTWLKVKNFVPRLPDKLSVGISASNASVRPFPAHFEAFSLKRNGDKKH
jgi:regulation of enolase protein 1 (concanavalin A-like superfamily)